MTMRRGRTRIAAAVVTGSIVAGSLTPAMAQEDPRYFYGPHMWDGGWSMIFGPLWGLLFLGGLIALAVVLVRWLGGPSGGGAMPASKTPLDILRERFARGEIDKEEFEERKRTLEM